MTEEVDHAAQERAQLEWDRLNGDTTPEKAPNSLRTGVAPPQGRFGRYDGETGIESRMIPSTKPTRSEASSMKTTGNVAKRS